MALKCEDCYRGMCDCHCHEQPLPDLYQRVGTASLEEIEAWMRHPRIVGAADTLNPQKAGLWPEVAERLLGEVKASRESHEACFTYQGKPAISTRVCHVCSTVLSLGSVVHYNGQPCPREGKPNDADSGRDSATEANSKARKTDYEDS
jgi:hypothetical protein